MQGIGLSLYESLVIIIHKQNQMTKKIMGPTVLCLINAPGALHFSKRGAFIQVSKIEVNVTQISVKSGIYTCLSVSGLCFRLIPEVSCVVV